MQDLADVRTASGRPKVTVLETCDFPIVRGRVGDYKVLVLPQRLRDLFDKGGMSVVRINSLALARTIPDFGGKASGDNNSLLVHQDHLDPFGDPRRFLMLTKRTDGARGASTVVMTHSRAAALLPLEQEWITDDARRALVGAERSYDKRFLISVDQYNRCFDKRGGYENVVVETIAKVAGEGASEERKLSLHLGILGYLIRGSCADQAMGEIMRRYCEEFFEEPWKKGGIVIIDNSRVYHARFGGNNPPLQRNFCI